MAELLRDSLGGRLLYEKALPLWVLHLVPRYRRHVLLHCNILLTSWAQVTEELTRASDVAEAVWGAATYPTSPMRLPAGADAVAWAAA